MEFFVAEKVAARAKATFVPVRSKCSDNSKASIHIILVVHRAIQMRSANAAGVCRWSRTHAPRHVLCRAISSNAELATTVHCVAPQLVAVEWRAEECYGTMVRLATVVPFCETLDNSEGRDMLRQGNACAAILLLTSIVWKLRNLDLVRRALE